MEITFGTRKSKWALAATNAVIQKAAEHFSQIQFRVVQLDSPGDLNHGDLAKIGGTTSFVDALSKEVAAGAIDAAVHTVKDISWPSEAKNFPDAALVAQGLRTTGQLVIPAVSQRNDPRDALVFRLGESFASFGKADIRVGTGSRVRAAALRQLYPHHNFVISRIRGNIDVRLEKLDCGEYDVLILSMDGLLALGQASRANKIFTIQEMPPALGQAIGAVEVRADNDKVIAAMQAINHMPTQICLRAEWATLKALNATCYTPIGGCCTVNADGTLSMFASLFSADGNLINARIDDSSAVDPEAIGIQIAKSLLSQGGHLFEQTWEHENGELSQDAT